MSTKTKRTGLNTVKWRSVCSVEQNGYGQKVYMDGMFTLSAALEVARKVSETYPDPNVYIFSGKGARQPLTAHFRAGVEINL